MYSKWVKEGPWASRIYYHIGLLDIVWYQRLTEIRPFEMGNPLPPVIGSNPGGVCKDPSII